MDTLEIFPRPSLRVRLYLILVHGLAMALVLALALRQPWLLVLLAGILLSLFYSLRQQRASRPERVTRLILQQAGEWRWHTLSGQRFEGEHLASSISLPWLVILHLRASASGRVFRLLLPADSLDVTAHRRLRMRLRVDQPGAAG